MLLSIDLTERNDPAFRLSVLNFKFLASETNEENYIIAARRELLLPIAIFDKVSESLADSAHQLAIELARIKPLNTKDYITLEPCNSIRTIRMRH